MSAGAVEDDVDIFGKALKLSGEIAIVLASLLLFQCHFGGHLARKVTSAWKLCLFTNADQCNRIRRTVWLA